MVGTLTNYFGKMEEKIDIESIKNSKLLKVLNLATVVTIAMLLFYGLGAYKHFKEIKRLK
jgi:multisubunit Na+/H+ antiporter MnhB subunit